MDINERLSSWDAMHRCLCGRWEYACRRGKWLWQRQVEGKFAYQQADVPACEVCGWDLTHSPAENIEAMDAKEWGGIIRNSCFYVEGAAVKLLPDGVDEKGLLFRDCNLDNRTLPAGVIVDGGCHRNLWEQNDGRDWVCDWKTDVPLVPVNVKSDLLAGLNCDPALIPARKLTDEELRAQEEARSKARDLHEVGKRLLVDGGLVECECVAKARAATAAALSSASVAVSAEVIERKAGRPDPLCKTCLGKGARHPALDEATVATLTTAGKMEVSG